MNNLKSLVEVSRRFQRSVNISTDLISTSNALDGYQLLQSGANVLTSLSDFCENTKQRAFTITGAFGVGKSALGLFICSLFSNDQRIRETAEAKLKNYPVLASSPFFQRKFDVTVLTGKKGSVEEDLNEAIFGQNKKPLKENIERFNRGNGIPKLVVLDEMGRYLTGQRFDNCAELQEFAESINCDGSKILFIGILHQNFTACTAFAPEVQKMEWQKVQGRFSDIPLTAHAEETLKMLSEAICVVKAERANREYSDRAIKFTVEYISSLRKINKEEYSETFKQSWPLNPVVCLILGPLSRRGFWQNNRSVFNFLTSQEPFGFQDYLSLTNINSPDLYGPCQLWDYLEANYGSAIASDPVESRNWAVATDCLARSETLNSENAVSVAKVVALISLFGASSGLKPGLDVLLASLPNLSRAKLLEAIELLLTRKVIVQRRHTNSYALFEGSDFDFDKKFKELSINETNPASVNPFLNIPLLVARKHYVLTGNIRFFRCKVVNHSTLKAELSSDLRGAAGRVLLWLDDGSIEDVARCVNDHVHNATGINLIGLPTNRSELVDAGIEIQKIQKILEDPILEGDRTARQEVNNLLKAANDRMSFFIESAFTGAEWIVDGGTLGVIHDQRALNQLLSGLCDKSYPFGLVFKNELFNREKISPNIKSARKNLIFSMLNHSSEDRFGIEGMPPEVMTYLSLFKLNGMHVQGARGKFSFVLPKENHALTELWKASSKFLDSENPVELKGLYKLWSQPPFGIKQGIMPVLLVYFYLLNKDVLTFYLEGFYQPDFTEELVQFILQRPDLIQLKTYKTDAASTQLVDQLHEYFEQEDHQLLDKSPLNVSRSLVRKVFTMPKWALSTSRVTKETKNFREVVLKASDPIKLLFDDLSNKVFGNKDFEHVSKKIIQSIEELESLTPSLCKEYREFICKELDSNNLEELRQRANSIKKRSGNLQLDAFINQIASITNSDESIESILGLVAGKQRGRWTDLDLIKATNTIADLSFKFRHLEGLISTEDSLRARRLLGIVTAGASGRREWIVDVPTKFSDKSKKTEQTISCLLKELSKKEALAVLINLIEDLQKEED